MVANMNQKRLQSSNPIDVILMLSSSALSTGIESLLFQKKNLRIRRFTPSSYMDFDGEPGQKKKKVVVLESTGGQPDSAECLISLLSDPDVVQVLMINTDNNRVQVIKKQQVVLTDKKDFAKIIQANPRLALKPKPY